MSEEEPIGQPTSGSDCTADPCGLLGKGDACAGIPPLCDWHYLRRHAKRPEIK